MEFLRWCLLFATGYLLGQCVERMTAPHRFLPCRVVLYLLLSIVPTVPSWMGDENPVLFFPFFMLIFLLCLRGPWPARLVMGGIFFALLFSTNMMLDTAEQWIFRTDGMWSVLFVCKLLFLWALIFVLYRSFLPGGLHLGRRLWALLGGLTLAPTMATLSFSLWRNPWEDDFLYEVYRAALYRLGFTMLPFVLLSCLALLFAMRVLAKHEQLEEGNRLGMLREVYFDGLQREKQQVRLLRHDLRNHLTALQGLLDQGEHEQAQRYLQELSDYPALQGGKRYCENEVANVVLGSKAMMMEGEGLIPDFSAALPDKLSITTAELCALLGNALDNATEAARLAKDKRIVLRLRLDKGLIMLRVENAVGQAVKSDLSTTKKDAHQHGYGLRGMREITQRYGGTLEVQTDQEHFELLVCVPNQQVKGAVFSSGVCAVEQKDRL